MAFVPRALASFVSIVGFCQAWVLPSPRSALFAHSGFASRRIWAPARVGCWTPPRNGGATSCAMVTTAKDGRERKSNVRKKERAEFSDKPKESDKAVLAQAKDRPHVKAFMDSGIPVVVLQPGKSRLFYEGNPVVFGGAVLDVLGTPSPGDPVAVVDHSGNSMGWGVYNMESMYRVRMLWLNSFDGPFTPPFDVGTVVEARLKVAKAVRTSLSLPSATTDAYRLVNGEGDRLSGLVVDMYAGECVISSSARWVEVYRKQVQGAVERVLGDEAKSVWWRQSIDRLKQDGYDAQGLAKGQEVVEGSLGGKATIIENGISYIMDLEAGQKTGHYCDQRDNRAWLGALCKGKSVLDTFCYSGGFALNAAANGASHVTAVDSSEPALALARENAQRNGFGEAISFVQDDVIDYLEKCCQDKKTFDVVVLDPPKYAPSRKDLERAKGKYRRLNKAAIQCVAKGGLLLTCTCSAAMAQSGELTSTVRAAAAEARRQVTIVRVSGPAADHPVSPSFPEGQYLSALLVAVA